MWTGVGWGGWSRISALPKRMANRVMRELFPVTDIIPTETLHT